MMFISHNRIRMHDVDLAGVIYFARQFRLIHDALEDFAASEGFPLEKIFQEGDYLFVIVHAESNYFRPLRLGDEIHVHVSVEKTGNSSFILAYKIYCGKELAGDAKTVHVTMDKKTRIKIPLPEELRVKLNRFIDE